MAEVLVAFDTVIAGRDGNRWTPRACGRVADDGLWEGWIEFVPSSADESVEPVRTPRETEQPSRLLLEYWAQGLTQVYLEGALQRALTKPPVRSAAPALSPVFDGPATRPSDAPRTASRTASPHPVLDPFLVYQEGEDVLLRELSALDTPRVRDIAVAFGFSDAIAAADAGRERLIANIVSGVRRPAPPPEHRLPEHRPSDDER